jgi:hypothetical protein
VKVFLSLFRWRRVEDSSFSEEKEAKRLYLCAAWGKAVYYAETPGGRKTWYLLTPGSMKRLDSPLFSGKRASENPCPPWGQSTKNKSLFPLINQATRLLLRKLIGV